MQTLDPRRFQFRERSLRRAAVAAAAAALVACGGDGGGEAPDLIVLNAANADAVAHAAAAGLGAIDASNTSQINSSGARAQALGSGGASWLPSRVIATVLQVMHSQAQRSRARPLAMVTLPPEPCAVSGTMTTGFDDRDGNGMLTAGDVVQIDFSQCQDDAHTVLDGRNTATLTQVAADGQSFSMRMLMTDVSQQAVSGRHGMLVNGTVMVDFATLSGTSERIRLVAEGDIAATVHTHLPYDDNLRLLSGFEQTATYDATQQTSTTVVSGHVHSQVANGNFRVGTVSPLVIGDSDAYPRSGAVEVKGSTGTMRLTALNTDQVQVELDADDNGSYEASQTQTWDWLF